MRRGLLVLVLFVVAPGQSFAEWQIKPFLGTTLGPSTTFPLSDATGGANLVFGASTVLLGEVVGIEGDVGYAPGLFQATPTDLVVGSSATTVTGNVVIAMPRHLTTYTLRLYFVGGAGIMRVNIEGANGGLIVGETLPATDVGLGVTGFLTNRIGVNWDVRRFQSFAGKEQGVSFGPEQLSFWRAAVAVAIRY